MANQRQDTWVPSLEIWDGGFEKWDGGVEKWDGGFEKRDGGFACSNIIRLRFLYVYIIRSLYIRMYTVCIEEAFLHIQCMLHCTFSCSDDVDDHGGSSSLGQLTLPHKQLSTSLVVALNHARNHSHHTHTHTHVRAHTHTHVRAHTHTRACTHTHTHTHARTHTQFSLPFSLRI